jgi:DHA2 family methylenomycin A resistance protein-like MFS transporter
LGAMSLGFAVVQLDVSVVNVAIKPIGAALGGGVSALQWLVGAYTLAFAALILSAGALADRIGAKRVFVGGFALFTACSVACGLAPSLHVLIAARAAQGVGAAILVPASLSLLAHAYPDADQRARAVGVWAAGASAALSGGPLVGGVLITVLGWRAIFFINVPIGLTGMILTLRYADETSRSPGRAIDLPGQVAAIVCLVALAAATIEGGAHGFAASGVLSAYALAAAAAVAFVMIERRRLAPMLPPDLFRSRSFSAASAIGLLVNVVFYGLIFVLSLFFQHAQHLSPMQTGLAFVPMTGAVMVANVLASRLAAARGQRLVILGGAILMAGGALALLNADATSSYPAMVAQLIAIGFGLGLIVPVMTAVLLASVDRSRSGIASGTLNTARQTGSVIGVALFGSLIDGHQLVEGMHVVLLIATVLTLCVAGVALLIGARPESG